MANIDGRTSPQKPSALSSLITARKVTRSREPQTTGEPALLSQTVALVVSDYFPTRGGTTTQTVLHAREFHRVGLSVLVLTRFIAGQPRRQVIDGIPVHRLALAGRGRLAKACDLVCTFSWLARHRHSLDGVNVMLDCDYALMACLAGLRGRTVMTWVTRGDARRQLSGPLGFLRKSILAHVAHVALSPQMSHELTSLGFPNAKVIPVPVDAHLYSKPTPKERAASRDFLGAKSGEIILFVGHLQPRKAVDQLILSLRFLPPRHSNVGLALVGGPIELSDHKYVQRLHDLVSEHGLGDRVRFWGPRDDILRFLHGADIFCLPSHREGMPNALLEAMSCGLPCVAPASAGGDELLNECGVIPPTNSPADLAEALCSLLDEPNLRARLGTLARSIASRQHGPSSIANEYIHLWHLPPSP
jgi:glycosyltransferase involved in cell wall biosynthesis